MEKLKDFKSENHETSKLVMGKEAIDKSFDKFIFQQDSDEKKYE